MLRPSIPTLTQKLWQMWDIQLDCLNSFRRQNIFQDISLVQLPTPIPFSTYIAPVALPRKSQASATYFNQHATVSGFGRQTDSAEHVSENLNFVVMNVIGNSECASIYGSKIVSDNIICARGFKDMHQNACLGGKQGWTRRVKSLRCFLFWEDSGGPLVIDDDGIPTLIGIVSFVSSRGCTFGDPSGYTKVAKYLPWISKVAGIPLRK